MAKVGKAFGFSVPPRVNVNIGGGTGGTGRAGTKRRRDDDGELNEEEWEEVDAVDKDASEAENEDEPTGRQSRRNGSDRRKETLGRRTVEKEVYRKGIERKKQKAAGEQWSG